MPGALRTGEYGNGVKVPDRTAAVRLSPRPEPLARAEKGAQAMTPSQKTCLRVSYRILRPQERYVPVRGMGVASHSPLCRFQRGISAWGRHILFFRARPGWYPGRARLCPAGLWYRTAAAMGSRRTALGCRPEGRASPWTRPRRCRREPVSPWNTVSYTRERAFHPGRPLAPHCGLRLARRKSRGDAPVRSRKARQK